MTIDEAYKTCFCEPYIVPVDKHKEARAVIDKAMVEVKQYRAIGTVAQCSNAMDIVKEMIERSIEPETIREYIKFEDKCVKSGYTIQSILEAKNAVEKYKNLLGKKVWWIDGLGNRVESTIICFYIEDGIEGVRCELRHCTTDAAEIGKSIHVIN